MSREFFWLKFRFGVCIRLEFGKLSFYRRKMLVSEVSKYGLLVRVMKMRRKDCYLWFWEMFFFLVDDFGSSLRE